MIGWLWKDMIKRISESEKQCNQLRLDNDSLNRILKEQDISITKEMDSIRQEVSNVIFNLKNEVNKRLLEFDKDMTSKVADRYFKTLEDIFRWNREFSFLEKYAQGDSKTLSDLRKNILQPFLEAKWNKEEKEKGNEVDDIIKTKGEIILEKRKALWDEKLKLGREEKDTKIIDAEIRVLDFVIGGAK